DFFEQERLWGERDYLNDLPDWHRELEAWTARTGIKVHVCLTGSKRVLTVQPGNQALAHLQRDAEKERFVKPGKWIPKLLKIPKSKKPGLVYVAGSPRSHARSFRARVGSIGRDASRRYDVGWDDPGVSRALRRAKATLYVVAPEARFTEFLPIEEIPERLWPFCSVPVALTARSLRFSSRLTYGRGMFAGDWDSLDAPPSTDCPSGFGYSEYTHPVADTDGAYIFYPSSSSEWLDACPYEPALLSKLAPRAAPIDVLLDTHKKDPALATLREAGQMAQELAKKAGVIEPRPYFPVKQHSRFEESADSARELAEGLNATLAHLARARESLGKDPRVHRRSMAQLRYAEFLLAVRAFHLESWADAAAAVPQFVKTDKGRENYLEKGLRLSIHSRMLFKLSDCLPAYDGRKAKSPLWGWQSETSKDYRSEKPIDTVLKSLRGKQAERARRMVAAAREVMAHEAKCAWGWMVYYSEVVPFDPCWSGTYKQTPGKRKKPSSDPSQSKTPPEKPEASTPGSGGTGPTSGG
ncbi:MAG: hypothetical protein ACYSX0_21390, partial [Planctomycetota bacterium]